MSISFQQQHQVTVSINPQLLTSLQPSETAASTAKLPKSISSQSKGPQSKGKKNQPMTSVNDKASRINKEAEQQYLAKSGAIINKENKMQMLTNLHQSSLRKEELAAQQQRAAVHHNGIVSGLKQSQPKFQDIPQSEDFSQAQNQGQNMLNQNNQFRARKMNPVSTIQFESQAITNYPKPESFSQRLNPKQAFAYNQQSMNLGQSQLLLNNYIGEGSQNTSNILAQANQASIGHSFSMRDPQQINDGGYTPDRVRGAHRSENLDSNGNIIRGRRLDSPQLVVVRELRDQEDLEEGTGSRAMLALGSSLNAGLLDREALMQMFYSGEEELRGGQYIAHNNHYPNKHQTLGAAQLNNFKGKRDRTNSEQRKKRQSAIHPQQSQQQQPQQIRQSKPKSKSQEKFPAKRKSKYGPLKNGQANQHKHFQGLSQLQLLQQHNQLNKISSIEKQNTIIEEEGDSYQQDQSNILPRQMMGTSKEGVVTKSTRELRTSMGFHELLNQLDKDISLQQSHQFDLKNKTSQDLLKLELSGIRRQNSSGANLAIPANNTGAEGLIGKSQEKSKNQMVKGGKPRKSNEGTNAPKSSKGTRSRSNDRGTTKSKSRERALKSQPESVNVNTSLNQISQLPRSLKKGSRQAAGAKQQIEKVFQYPIAEVTPDRNQNHQGVTSNSFLHSEHGRQMPLAITKSLKAHEDGLPPTNINVILSKIKVHNPHQQQADAHSSQSKEKHPQSAFNQGVHSSAGKRGLSKSREPSSSPERQGPQSLLQYPGGGKIDKLVRENLKKAKSKEEEEKLLRINNDEALRRKKELNDLKNQQVRTANKQKTKLIASKNVNLNTVESGMTQGGIASSQSTQELMSQEKIQNLARQLFQNEKAKQKIGLIIANGSIRKEANNANGVAQKQSQTQKIDFEKIKQGSQVAKNLKVKNHRKSYGLEFIDIKREIQEELRTIDLKYKNPGNNNNNQLISSKHLLLQDSKVNNEDSQTQINIQIDSVEPAYQQLQQQRAKLKIKQRLQQQSSSNKKDNRANLQNYESEQPSSKVIVVKKNKIRKFMEQKKKLILIQKFREQKEEMTKAIKMKENICKLNDYCKKKLEKQQHKKRNATIPYNPDDDQQPVYPRSVQENNRRNLSKVSGRKILFENIELKKTLNPRQSDKLNDTLTYNELDEELENDNDSSRLSTEFYEEYYRLINSIKKEQRILLKHKQPNLSRAEASSQNVTQKSIKHLLQSPPNHKSHSPITHKQQSVFSPKQLVLQNSQLAGGVKSLKKKSKSKSNLKHNDGISLLNQNPNMQRSQGNLQIQQMKNPLRSTDYPHQQQVRQSQQSTLNLKERAESAPLLMSQANLSQQKKQQSKRKSPGAKQDTALRKRTQKKKSYQRSKLNLRINQLSDEEQMQYVLEQIIRIQSAYRKHLHAKGFYAGEAVQSLDDQEQSGQDTVVHNSTVLLNNFGSVTRSEKDNYDTQQFQIQAAPFSNPDSELQKAQVVVGDDYQESEGEEEEEYYEEQQQPRHPKQDLIIINEQSAEDDRKIVYMSNINSCSLPQTPKIEESSQPSQSQQSRKINQHIQKVFEYKPSGADHASGNEVGTQDIISQHLYVNDHLHQSISYKPSILESHSSELVPKILDLKKAEGVMMMGDLLHSANSSEEEEKGDGRMAFNIQNRLTEFRQVTPREQNDLVLQISNQPTVRQMFSQQVSIQSQQYAKHSQQLASLSGAHSHSTSNNQNPSSGGAVLTDLNSHSSQSLFDRNSFQQFSQTNLQQVMQSNDFLNMLEIREKALAYRKDKEKKFIKRMYKDRKYSPRTYTSKKQKLEKWVQIEEKRIEHSKQQFEAEWHKTLKIIEETQKDVETMRQKMKVHIDNNQSHNSNSHHQLNSQLLHQNQGGQAFQQRFASHNSSRNSDSSYHTVAKPEPRKSILELDEFQPLSQRSVRLSASSQKQNRSVDKYLAIKSLGQDLANSRRSQPMDKKSSLQNSLQRVSQGEQREENLIDFLEQSWIKNQKQLKEFSSSHTHKTNQDRVSEFRPSIVKNLASDILIQDQNSRLKESPSPANQQNKNMHFDYIQDSDEVSQNLITERRHDGTIDNIVQQFQRQEQRSGGADERPLTRSRSEQDLSDLLKKSKLNFNELDLSQSREEKIHQLESQLQLDSYRFDQRGTPEQLVQSEMKLKPKMGELKIQENMFEDSSNRFSKGRNYYQEAQELQSNDSLLDESELNNYFQDQKFSIEDFKSLDKRKLAQKANDDAVEEEGRGSLIGRADSQANANADESLKNLEEEELEQSQSNLFQQSSSNKIETGFDQVDLEPPYYDGRRQFADRDEELKDLSADQIFPTAFMHHQQALLFSGSKPGENIKIADILRKNQSLQDPSISNSFQFGDSSQLLFHNAQINQSMTAPSLNPLLTPAQAYDYSALADQVTEEILQSMLSTLTVVNRREKDAAREDSSHLSQELAADVFIMNAQLSDKEHRRETTEFRIRIVIEQDLVRVENYINEVIQQLQQAELAYLTTLAHNPSAVSTQDSNYHRQFLQVLTAPIKKNELELLNMLQTSEIGSYEHFETALDLNSFPILPIDLYLDIERLREENQIRMLYQNGANDVDLESSVMQESTHIHNKSVFDALNESLMKFRPYGIQGEPMPWSNKNRRLQTKVDTNSVDTERLFMMVKQDVLRWAQTFAGCSPSPIFLFRRQQLASPTEESEQFDDELFQETRERRLATMLATEVVENEHQWLNYEFEEAQVKIDLSDMILEHLVEEVVLFMNHRSTDALSD